MTNMSQKSQIIQKQSSAKITKDTKNKKLSAIKKDFEKNFIFLATSESSIIASLNQRYNHSNNKSAIPLINKIGESVFNYSQLQLIKKQNAEYDTKLGYWFISI